jgi:cytochrome c oxidase cbb3-type subunit II
VSDQLAAASAALGVPEALVERSAAARAAVSGASTEELLTEWAGGEAAPRTAPEPTEEPSAAEETSPGDTVAEPSADEPAAPPPIVVEQPAPVAEQPVPAGPYRAPVLVGTRDNPMAMLAGVVGLFVIVVMVGLLGPSIPEETPGARTSEVAYSTAAREGQDLYANAGCASCHTQMVRPVVADIGLGAVTLNDTDQILGTRRFGPDLSDVGSRLDSSQIEATIAGLGGHPASDLSSDDLGRLVAYLTESSTAPSTGEGS